MAAALSFIMMLVMAGCPVEPDPESLASVTFAAGSNLSSGSFSGLSGFRGDLYSKYFAEGGGAGRYTRSSAGSTWTKVAGGENSGLLTVSGAALASHIVGLPANSAANPHTVKLDPVNITADGVMGEISFAVTNRYITLDLSACSAEGNTISSNSSTPGPNDMNLIGDNQYIVGIILPSGLTSIGEWAFSGFTSLTSITIPASVNSIGGGAFVGGGNLRFTVTGAGGLSTLG
jgi:hypothetical protein